MNRWFNVLFSFIYFVKFNRKFQLCIEDTNTTWKFQIFALCLHQENEFIYKIFSDTSTLLIIPVVFLFIYLLVISFLFRPLILFAIYRIVI